MAHWKMRAVYREQKTQRVIGYGEPITVPEKLGRKMVQKDRADWDVLSDNADVPDARPEVTRYSPMTGVAEMTEFGEQFAGKLQEQIKAEVSAPGANVEWGQVGAVGAPVPIAKAREAAKAAKAE